MSHEVMENSRPVAAAELAIDRSALTMDDGGMLAQFGVEPDQQWLDNMNQLAESGSRHIDDPANAGHRQEIIDARDQFFTELGFDENNVAFASYKANNACLRPIDTFIGLQRVFYSYGLDAVKIINATPAAIGYAPESVRNKITNLEELGLDAVKIINARPSAIGYAPESVRDKVASLEELGLDAVKIINAMPSAISLAPESVKDKVANLEELGLDTVKIINATPAAIGYAPESVRNKISYINRLAKTLEWQGSVNELINYYPAVLSFSRKKLGILARIAADSFAPERRHLTKSEVTASLINPLENYIAGPDDVADDQKDFYDLARTRGKHSNRLPKVERRARALGAVASGGISPKIAKRYLVYAKPTNAETAQYDLW